MHSLVLTIVVVIANTLGAVMAVPQAAQMLRSRQVDGVSAAWAAMGATTNSWWVIYGIGIRDWAIIPVSVISVSAYLVVGWALIRYGTTAATRVPTLATMAKATIGLGVLPLAGLLAGGWTLAGVVLGTVYGIQLTPAVAAVYRSIDVSGVSRPTWALAWLEALFWGIYALAARDAGLGMLAVTGLAMSSAVLVRLFIPPAGRLRRRRPVLSPG